jgi:arsenate reductase
MAEALLQRHGGGRYAAESAGLEPKGVHPLTLRALAEVGIDWSDARSKPMSEMLGRRFDLVVTVCDRAREACPVFPGAGRQLHWDLDDPADATGTDGARLAVFRRVRDEIDARVQDLITAEPAMV